MHIVNWNSDKYTSIQEAAVEPAGLSVLGILFEVTNTDNPALTPLVNVLKDVRDPGKAFSDISLFCLELAHLT